MNLEILVRRIAGETEIASHQVEAAVHLLDDSNTIPFIARYRKEKTGGLDEEQLQTIALRLSYLRQLTARKKTILRTIEAQGKLTLALRDAIEGADTLQLTEDLYRPYRPKRRTRSMVAREQGLEPLAQLILAQPIDDIDRDLLAQSHLSDVITSGEAAYAGARDIVAETVTDDAVIRSHTRAQARREAYIVVSVDDEKKDERGVYRSYYSFASRARELRPHQTLAINRGAREGALKISFTFPDDENLAIIAEKHRPRRDSAFADDLMMAIEDGYTRLLAPALKRDLLRELTEAAHEYAISVFATNLKALLLQPPLRGKTLMGIDPGYRTGCKVALVSATGKYLASETVYPHQPKGRWAEATKTVQEMVKQAGVEVIAIGNGTASRETEHMVAEAIKGIDRDKRPQYVIVNEAGASVYSASKLARKELPRLDVSMRGAVSIARRLQDPLAELVKIDPKSIGVGLYQHDVDQKSLGATLLTVVESVVNSVGVSLNTASVALLRYVSGVGPKMATSLVRYRDEHGPYHNLREILEIEGIGPKSFQQAAGFLRIGDGEEPLDNTPIHPESYAVVHALFDLLGVIGNEPNLPELISAVRSEYQLSLVSQQLDVGAPTLTDILDALVRPGRDPRDDVPKPLLRENMLKMEDLEPGLRLRGTVRNVVAFGAFVDVGLKQDGLVHVSRMSDDYVGDPHRIVAVGDVVEVTIIDVDKERGRIGLSLRKQDI